MVEALDDWLLLRQPPLVLLRKRSVLPVLLQRQQLADRELLGQLPIFADLGTWSRWIVYRKARLALPVSWPTRSVSAHVAPYPEGALPS